MIGRQAQKSVSDFPALYTVQVGRPGMGSSQVPSPGRAWAAGSAGEAALIASARAGNPDAFNCLVRAYQDVAYSVACRILAHPDSAADATQEAFLAAYRALGGFRGGSFRSWLLHIVTNACYDQLRRRKSRPQLSLDGMVEEPDCSTCLADRSESPEEATLRRGLAREIEAGIAWLPPDQRMVLVLSDVQGLSYDEIVDITGASLGTVKSRLSRARARLRDYLSRHWELDRP